MIKDFWKGIYFFLGIFENHIPIDIANAPINKATTTLLTPSQRAPAAAAPAPTVHRGQCAEIGLARKIAKNGKIKNFLFIFIDSDLLMA